MNNARLDSMNPPSLPTKTEEPSPDKNSLREHVTPRKTPGISKPRKPDHSKSCLQKKNTASGTKATNTGDKDKKKLVVACIGCRKKKIKCSSDRPACSNCLRLNIPCEYPVIRNRGSRFGYMEMLNRRMQHLEKYINCSTNPDYRPQFVTIHQKPQDPSQLPYTVCGSTRGTVNSGYTNIRSNLNILMESPSNNLESSNTNSYERYPNKISQAQEADTLITQLGPRLRKELTPPPSVSVPRQSKYDSTLPPQDIIIHLTELYFRNIHGQTYNFLHKPTFIPRIKQGKVNKTLLLALCGLTARYSRHPSIVCGTAYQAGEKFIAEARKALSEEFDEPTIETIQAVIFIVQHDFFRSKSKKAMIYVSLAIRMAATLELHIEPHDPNMSFKEREERRRTYWSLISLDRLAHSGPHWQVHLRTDTLQLQLPCRDYFYENNIPVVTETLQGTMPPSIRVTGNSPPVQKEEKGTYAYIVIATILWCDVNKYVMEGFKKETIPPWKEGSTYHALETRLQNLFTSIPKIYQYSRENLIAMDTTNQGTVLVHLHAELLLSLCYLSRSMYPFNYKTMKFDEPPPKSFLERAATNIMACANAQSSMIEDVLAMEDFHMAPFIGFGVFAVSSVHIANSFSPDPTIALAAKNNLATNLKFLVIMREYFYSVGVWCIILKDRYFQKARRHKLKAQQNSYNSNLRGNSGSITNSIRNSENDEGADKAEGTEGGVADGFSRPGTPPVAYAPEELMNVAANKLQDSEPPSEMSSPRGASRSWTGSPRPNPPPQFDSDNIKWQLRAEISKQSDDSSSAAQQQARTWKRAVPQAYENQCGISQPPYKENSQNMRSNFFPNKRSKVEKTHVMPGSDFNASVANPSFSQPVSPSNFADLLSMPGISQGPQIKMETKPVLPEQPLPDNTYSNPKPDQLAREGSGELRPDGPGVGTNPKTNFLMDNSGEWLNSLELSEFAQFANDGKYDIKNPVQWFSGKTQEDGSEAGSLTADTCQSGFFGGTSDQPGTLEEEGALTSESLMADSSVAYDSEVGDRGWLALPQPDYMQHVLANQLDIYGDSSEGGQMSSSQATTPGIPMQHTPKTKSLLDEIFQQVARENFQAYDTSDSPESLSPS